MHAPDSSLAFVVLGQSYGNRLLPSEYHFSNRELLAWLHARSDMFGERRLADGWRRRRPNTSTCWHGVPTPSCERVGKTLRRNGLQARSGARGRFHGCHLIVTLPPYSKFSFEQNLVSLTCARLRPSVCGVDGLDDCISVSYTT